METLKKRNYKDTSIWMDHSYKMNWYPHLPKFQLLTFFSEMRLAQIFSHVSLISIRRQMELHNNHFIPTAESLQKLVDVRLSFYPFNSFSFPRAKVIQSTLSNRKEIKRMFVMFHQVIQPEFAST